MSPGKLLLDRPKGKMLTKLGARSFSAVAPKLWSFVKQYHLTVLNQST